MASQILRLSQQRRRGRFNLHLNDGRVIGVADKILADFRLAVGQKLSDRRLLQLIEADWQEKGYQKALRLLARRPQSEKEISDKLSLYFRKSKISPGPKIFEKILKRLRKNNLLDDQAFARWWLEQRRISKASSRRRIGWELRRKGIAPAAIDSLLENYDELPIARLLAAKKLAQYGKLTAIQRRQKLWLWLQGKGFAPDTIRAAIDELLGKR